mmetsp:Transcript_20699/g.26759  ORF Transcript_20699/g.26759 Transcript_20699/m.26759 type:complete len:138 (-) Transcript_20699:69-482(-)
MCESKSNHADKSENFDKAETKRKVLRSSQETLHDDKKCKIVLDQQDNSNVHEMRDGSDTVPRTVPKDTSRPVCHRSSMPTKTADVLRRQSTSSTLSEDSFNFETEEELPVSSLPRKKRYPRRNSFVDRRMASRAQSL